MPVKTTAVSFVGDEIYLKALKALAYQHGVTVGEFVRGAVDTIYGDELAPHLERFHAQDRRENAHTDKKASTS